MRRAAACAARKRRSACPTARLVDNLVRRVWRICAPQTALYTRFCPAPTDSACPFSEAWRRLFRHATLRDAFWPQPIPAAARGTVPGAADPDTGFAVWRRRAPLLGRAAGCGAFGGACAPSNPSTGHLSRLRAVGGPKPGRRSSHRGPQGRASRPLPAGEAVRARVPRPCRQRLHRLGPAESARLACRGATAARPDLVPAAPGMLEGHGTAPARGGRRDRKHRAAAGVPCGPRRCARFGVGRGDTGGVRALRPGGQVPTAGASAPCSRGRARPTRAACHPRRSAGSRHRAGPWSPPCASAAPPRRFAPAVRSSR